MIDYKGNPFFLNDIDIQWVESTFNSMTTEEKIGQLFCLHGDTHDRNELDRILNTYHPGGIMYRPGLSKEIQKAHCYLQKNSRIPMLIAANLESGGDGIGNDGTFYGRQIQVAATEDDKYAYRLGLISAKEGKSVGCNWAFAPVIDIDYNHSNPITNVRTFGNNSQRVLNMAKAYMKACQENDVAVSIKHFPGDGVDDRDQHLLTSVNSLSYEKWKETYGVIYKEMIDNGAKSVMAAHIMFPDYIRTKYPDLEEEAFLPASYSTYLLNDLLRKELGFNGLIITDSVNMSGLTSVDKRCNIVPGVIIAGCDMILFTRDLEEDYNYMLQAYENGTLTEKRLNEAVKRILAMKASLHLHENSSSINEDLLGILKCEQHVKWAKELSDASITLVKDTQSLLPLSIEKHRRVLFIVLGDKVSASGKPAVNKIFSEQMIKEGFEIIYFDETKHSHLLKNGSIENLKNTFDLVIYFANIKTASNQTNVRIQWKAPLGVDVPWFVNEIPTLFISLANPYHLQDVPMIKTYINAYTANEYNPIVLVDKLLGKSEFKGKNPVDPFCNYEESRR